MTSEEKHTLKERLFLNIAQVSIRTPYSFVSVFTMKARYSVISGFAMILLAVFVQGADASLPGETLYGMKRDVNERVLAAFAFSPSTKAKVETTLATRRLEEIEHVMLDMSSGGIEEEEKNEVLTELATAATEHSKQASSYIEEIHQDGDTDEALVLASKLETTISIHAGILKEIDVATSNEENVSPIAEALAIIETTESTVENLGGTIKGDISSDPTLIDEVEAREHLDEAIKNINQFESEFGVIALEESRTSSEILSKETQMVINLDAISNATQSDANQSTEEAEVIPNEVVIEEITPEVSLMSEIVLPENEIVEELEGNSQAVSVKVLISECKSLFENKEYAVSFVKCTEVIEAISALRIRMDLIQKTQTEPVAEKVTQGEEVVVPATEIGVENELEVNTTANISEVPLIENLQNSKGVRNLINSQ